MLRVWRKPADDNLLFELEHVQSRSKKRFSSWEALQLYLNRRLAKDELGEK